VFLNFRGQSSNALFELHVSAELDAAAIAPLLHLEAGRNDIRLAGAEESPHRALVLASGDGVRLLPPAVSPDVGDVGDVTDRATVFPQVLEADESVTVLLARGTEVVFSRRDGGGLTGIERVTVDGRELLRGVADAPSPSVSVLSSDRIVALKGWATYLERRRKNGGRWPSRGSRAARQVQLADADYRGHRIDGHTVALRLELADSEEEQSVPGGGELEWILSSVTRTLGGREYRGIGWKVRLTDCSRASSLRLVEPALAHHGDWAFVQTWGGFVESRVDFATPFAIPPGTYGGQVQPFYFTAGRHGAVISFFDRPVAARVALSTTAGRVLSTLDVPLGSGCLRETPTKLWLWADASFDTKWTALDEWTSVWDAVARHYRKPLELGTTTPRPTLIWTWPGDEYFQRVQERGLDTIGELWLRDLARRQLPEAARLGIGTIYVQTPWESDAEHRRENDLPGSFAFGSGHAPRRLRISDAIGGEKALRELCDRAHELGVKIVLWTNPGHLSNNSPLLREHPEWIKWRADGTPETHGYGDVTGTTLRADWFDHVVAQYRAARKATGFDGILQDSFLSFCMFPDHAAEQPVPELDEALALQREIWKMGATEVHVEGCGLLGISHGGYGHEPPIPADLDGIRGREYGLYRYVADTFVEPESYHRALASKGVVGIPSLGVLRELPEKQRVRIARSNHDYLRVVDKMERRRLIGEGQHWRGVAWTRAGSDQLVLFAFERFSYALAGVSVVEDVTVGTRTTAVDRLETTPWHTYVVTRRRE